MTVRRSASTGWSTTTRRCAMGAYATAVLPAQSNLELKARDPDPAASLERALALGAEDRGELVQRDSYSDLLLDTRDALLRAAEAAMRNAYAPHSDFKVGAALRAPSGAVYSGANVENSAYPQSQCAEASAIGALIAAGGG